MSKLPEPYIIRFDRKVDYFIHWWFWLWGFIAATSACWKLSSKFLNWLVR